MLTSAGRTNLAKGIKARHQKGIIGTHFDAPEACSQRDGDWPCDAVELAEAVLASDGHELAKRQIAKHGKDRYPNPVLQLYKVLDELRELCVELEKSRCSYVVRATQTVRSEYADVGLALYELGNKLGIDLIDEMLRLVEADERDFREHR